jgi:hypothetical protein
MVVAAAGAAGSNHGASARERTNAQSQKGEAYFRNREVLASAKPEQCTPSRRAAFEGFLTSAKQKTEEMLKPQATLAESNQWSDTLRASLSTEQVACAVPDAPVPPAVVRSADTGISDAPPPTTAAPVPAAP